MPDLTTLCSDLDAESDALDAVVDGLDDDGWVLATPAQGWAVRDAIGHLGATDRSARLALTDPTAFLATLPVVVADIGGFLQGQLDDARTRGPADLLLWWREGRTALTTALRDADPGAKVPWYGPPMSPASFATARLMETFAHGQDVVDGLRAAGRSAHRDHGARVRHIAHLGIRTRGFSHLAHDLPAPTDDVRVELTAPDGTLWTWGPDDAPQRVTGPAVDFALLVTQRRHLDDLALRSVGDGAAQWLRIAQAFAGPPGSGRRPGLPPA